MAGGYSGTSSSRCQRHEERYDVLTAEIPSEGNYRIGLYFGKIGIGETIWLDNIKMTTDINSK